jgi:hypothetical protein
MAIGIGYNPVGQPTAPIWYRQPVKLIGEALQQKQRHYDLNRTSLDNSSKTLDGFNALEGVDKARAIELRAEYQKMEDDIVASSEGDLSKADVAIREYTDRLNKDFSSTGEAGSIDKSYKAYAAILKSAAEMTAKGDFLSQSALWAMTEEPLRKYNESGGYKANYETSGQYTTFAANQLSPDIDIGAEALLLATGWMADTEYSDVAELGEYAKKNATKTTANGYTIWKTLEGREFVDKNEIAQALITGLIAKPGVKEQLVREYNFSKAKGTLDPTYKRTTAQRKQEVQEKVDDTRERMDDIKTFMSSNPTLKQYKEKYDELLGSQTGFDIFSYRIDKEGMKRTFDEMLLNNKNDLDSYLEHIVKIDEGAANDENYEEATNRQQFIYDNVEANTVLAAEKFSFNKDILKTQITSDGSIEAAAAKRKSETAYKLAALAAEQGKVTKEAYSSTSNVTFDYEVSKGIHDAHVKTITESKAILENNVHSVITEYANTYGMSANDLKPVFDKLTSKNLSKYMDSDGDFLSEMFLEDNPEFYKLGDIAKLFKQKAALINRHTRQLHQADIEIKRLKGSEEQRVTIATATLDEADRNALKGDIKTDDPVLKKELDIMKSHYKALNDKSKYPTFAKYALEYDKVVRAQKAINDGKTQSYRPEHAIYITKQKIIVKEGLKNLKITAYDVSEALIDRANRPNAVYANLYKNSFGKATDALEKELTNMMTNGKLTEHAMLFTGVPNLEKVVDSYNSSGIKYDIPIINIEKEKGLGNNMTVLAALRAKGLQFPEKITNVELSKGTIGGTQIMKVYYEGKDAEGKSANAYVFVDREEMNVTDDQGNSVLPSLNDVDRHFSNASYELSKLGGFGTSYIMDIGGNEFSYNISSNNREKSIVIKKPDGTEQSLGFDTGMMAMFNLQEASRAVDKLDFSNKEIPYITVGGKKVLSRDILSSYMLDLVNMAKAGQGFEYINSLLDKVLVVPNNGEDYKNLSEIDPIILTVGQLDANASKYTVIKHFTPGDLQSMNNVFKDTPLRFKNIKKYSANDVAR